MRVRSGGHDYEGQSYVSHGDPFVLLDFSNLRAITTNATEGTAWVESGATLGELYYHINVASNNKTAAFPAGLCLSVGVGGLLGGGGIGTLLRKYGTSADNIIDALVVDANGDILDRKTMGEDLFWAIRGGDSASFCLVLSYKINLVYVPPTVTVFRINKTLEHGATKLVERWQHVLPWADDELFIRVLVTAFDDKEAKGNRTIQTTFECLYLGKRIDLLSILDKIFPELGVEVKDCTEMSWIDSAIFFKYDPSDGKTYSSILLDRRPYKNSSFKAKSDFVREPISEEGWEKIYKFLLEGVGESLQMVMDPSGGRVYDIAETAIPFPHRKGNLYNIQHYLKWSQNEEAVNQKHLDWMKRYYNFMAPYVSKNPRAAYINYKDLDLGINENGKTSYSTASVWGKKYFLNNFERLAQVKAKVDPHNYFWNEQSIPPFST